MITRRSMLLSAMALAGCSGSTTANDKPSTGDPGVTEPVRSAYGNDVSQFGELTAPTGSSRGIVIVIHGGYWKSAYDLDLGRPLAASLAAHGWHAWNIEYRRVGNGGGTPATFDDVHLAIEHVSTLNVPTERIITLGHSAGGHLAVWAAGRHRYAPWTGARIRPTAAVSQAGVVDLIAAGRDGLGGGAAKALLGHAPSTADRAYDPQQQIPLDVPVRLLHGRDDDTVPISQSRNYVTAATKAGADASLTELEGGHFEVIDTSAQQWARHLQVLDELAGR